MRALHIYCDGGFGNRFNALIAGLLLAKAANLEPLVVWPCNNWCGARFGDLFENQCAVIERELASYAADREALHFFMTEDHLNLGVAYQSPLQIPTLVEALDYLREADKDVFFYTPLIPVFFEWPTLRDQIHALRFRRDLVGRVESFLREQQLDDFWGVQIRKTDFGGYGANDDALYELILSSPQKRFFVCSDDKDVEQRFGGLPNVAIHSKRAHVEKLVEGDWNTPTQDYSGRVYTCNVNRSSASVEDAVVDLLILSRSQIVQTSNSTFLNTASLLQRAAAELPPQPLNEDSMTILYDSSNQHRVLNLFSMMRPLAMRTHTKVRLGNEYDGGYVVPSAALDCDAVVSIGVGPDVSFDLALAQRGAKIIQFDHTVEGLPMQHPSFRFFKQGWGPRTEGDFLSLADITSRLDPGSRRKMLKFDIEGGEYEAFEALTPEDLLPFEVICCELHDFSRLADEAFFGQVKHLLSCLYQNHAPVHLHANNYQSFVLIEGVPIPQVLELSYLRRDLDSFNGYSHDPIPGPLDRPNHPLRPDLCMNPF